MIDIEGCFFGVLGLFVVVKFVLNFYLLIDIIGGLLGMIWSRFLEFVENCGLYY